MIAARPSASRSTTWNSHSGRFRSSGFLGDPGRQLLEVGDAGVRWEVGDVEMLIEVDVRVGPARPDAERIAHDDLVEGLDGVEAGGDETAHGVEGERLRSSRRIEDEHTQYLPGHGRRLGQEETSVESGDRVSHGSTVLLTADPIPTAMDTIPRGGPTPRLLDGGSRPWQPTERSRPSPGTAGRSRSWPATRCRCTCRRRAARPVSIEVARIGVERTVVFEERGVPVDDHATPADAWAHGCGWPAASELTVDAGWRSGYYEVVLSIDVDGKTRRSHAFFVVRPQPGPGQAADPAGARHQHLARLQRLRRSQPLHRRDAGVAAAADVARLPVQARWRRPAGHVAAPARPAVGGPRRLPAYSTTCRRTAARPAGPTGSCRSCAGPSARATRSTSSPTPTSRITPNCSDRRRPAGSTCRSATTSTGRRECATRSRASSAAAATPRSCRATPRSGRSASRTAPTPGRTRRHDGRLQGLLQARPGVRHRSPVGTDDASGRTTCSIARRTT